MEIEDASRRTRLATERTLAVLVAWQRDSCPYGIDGWLLWTWDTKEQPELWNA